MKIGVLKEIYPGEKRVAATPDTIKKLKQLGFDVIIESGAGENSNISDSAYVSSGAEIISDTSLVWSSSDIVLKVRAPIVHPILNKHEVDLMHEGLVFISFIWPSQNQELLQKFAEKKISALAMDMVPRISRAQKMDALSSMANISGYRAVIESANAFGRSFMGQITAAGKLPPTKVMIIGAGVAGLAAIGVARGLGAIVRAFDTRPEVKEQVESMGAEFLEVNIKEDGSGAGGYAKVMSPEFIKAEMELFAKQAKDVDIIITTAQIPGRKAPILITKEMVESMKDGSVVVDLAAEQGGNCELTKANEIIKAHGVTIIGLTDMPSRLPTTSSQLYGTNLFHILSDMGGSEKFRIDMEDEVIRGALVTHEGDITWPPPKKEVLANIVAKKETPQVVASTSHGHGHTASTGSPIKGLIIGAIILSIVGLFAPKEFLNHFTVFVLSCFIGWQVIWNVTPALHTPLMSVTNAISGIIILGGMLQLSDDASSIRIAIGIIAVLVAGINIAGGFLVTQRMLAMFRK